MKVVWSPTIPKTKPKFPYYKNVWFLLSKHEAWTEPHRYRSIAEAMESAIAEDTDCIRVAILELVD